MLREYKVRVKVQGFRDCYVAAETPEDAEERALGIPLSALLDDLDDVDVYTGDIEDWGDANEEDQDDEEPDTEDE